MARKIGLFVLALAMVGAMCGAALAGDTLAEVRKSGVLVAGGKDSLPPFGSVPPNTKEFFEYDIDFVNEVQPGDSFVMAYEQKWQDGALLREGQRVRIGWPADAGSFCPDGPTA